MKYSIFIIPPEPIFSKLKKVIFDLAGEYNGRVFEPHITIVGEVEAELSDLKDKFTELASKISRLELTLGDVSYSTNYFQNVFVRIDPTPELLQLNIDAKFVLGLENNLYMPHISLLYGNQDLRVRDEVAQKTKIEKESFTADRLFIVPSGVEISKWIPVAEIPFTG